MNDPKFHFPKVADDPFYPLIPRKQPLPSSRPKSPDEDPKAPERVRKIMASPSYRRADCDLDFLQRDEVRPSRLQLEFLKPEVFFEEQGVCDTIVVFGGYADRRAGRGPA